jgi:hypothetical protein
MGIATPLAQSKGNDMKKSLAIIAAIMAISSVAYAQCPVYAPYRCVPGASGKMICGCGV